LYDKRNEGRRRYAWKWFQWVPATPTRRFCSEKSRQARMIIKMYHRIYYRMNYSTEVNYTYFDRRRLDGLFISRKMIIIIYSEYKVITYI